MNDYQYHYLFASPVSYVSTSRFEHSCWDVYNEERNHDWQDLETFDLEDFKYNFVNISAFRLVDAESNFTRNLLKDMEKFQPIGQSILSKSYIIQVSIYIFSEKRIISFREIEEGREKLTIFYGTVKFHLNTRRNLHSCTTASWLWLTD